MTRTTLARPLRPKSDEERILPLINVVFLLLIFVMVSSSLTTADPFNTMPPESQSKSGVEPVRFLVVIAADGRLALDGKPLDLDALVERLSAAATGESKPRVQIQADGGSDSVRVIEVLTRIGDIGLKQVKLITMQAPS